MRKHIISPINIKIKTLDLLYFEGLVVKIKTEEVLYYINTNLVVDDNYSDLFWVGNIFYIDKDNLCT